MGSRVVSFVILRVVLTRSFRPVLRILPRLLSLLQCLVGYIQRSLAIDRVGQHEPTGGACSSPGFSYAISVGHRGFEFSPLQFADCSSLLLRSVPYSMIIMDRLVHAACTSEVSQNGIGVGRQSPQDDSVDYMARYVVMIVTSPSLSSHETFVQSLCGYNIHHMIQQPKVMKKIASSLSRAATTSLRLRAATTIRSGAVQRTTTLLGSHLRFVSS